MKTKDPFIMSLIITMIQFFIIIIIVVIQHNLFNESSLFANIIIVLGLSNYIFLEIIKTKEESP